MARTLSLDRSSLDPLYVRILDALEGVHKLQKDLELMIEEGRYAELLTGTTASQRGSGLQIFER